MNEMAVTTFTCRTCLTMFNINEMVANPANLKVKIETCIPELTLGIIKDYVVCRECVQSVLLAYKFKKMCLETEEKIFNYMHTITCKGSVDINSVVQWHTRQPIETIDLADSSSEASETINLDSDDDLLEIHKNELDVVDFKVFLEEEATAVSNYQKLCEIEDRFANYSIDEFYSKGLVKLPECSVVLDRLSQDLVQKYSVNTSVNTINERTECKVMFKSKASKVNRNRKYRKTKFHCKKFNHVTSRKASLRLQSDRYKCTKCSYFTLYEDSLFYHLKQHNEKCTKLSERITDCATLKCVECNYKTHTDQDLISHCITEHYDRPPFLCKLCKSNFKLPTLLINHLIGHFKKCAEIETEHNYCTI